MTVALLLACSSGTVVLTDPSELTGDTGAVTDDTGDTQEEEEAPSYEGSYEVELVLAVEEWGWEMCNGKAEVEIDDEGNVDFDADCEGYENDWAWSTPVWGSGLTEDDGEIAGTSGFEWWSRDEEIELEGELWGSVDEDGDLVIELYFEDVPMGRGEEADVNGWLGTD